jgi:hypothetical protein
MVPMAHRHILLQSSHQILDVPMSLRLLILTVLFPSLLATAECPVCSGTKNQDCKVCTAGKLPCPGPCVKLDTSGRTDKPEKPGWILITYVDQNGKRRKSSCSPGHIGDVWHYTNGIKPQGKHAQCNGTSFIPCTTCTAAGVVPCPECSGTGSLSDDQLKTYNERIRAERIANSFVLKDGSTVAGQFFGLSGTTITIKLDGGEWRKLDVSEVASVPAALKERIPLPE